MTPLWVYPALELLKWAIPAALKAKRDIETPVITTTITDREQTDKDGKPL